MLVGGARASSRCLIRARSPSDSPWGTSPEAGCLSRWAARRAQLSDAGTAAPRPPRGRRRDSGDLRIAAKRAAERLAASRREALELRTRGERAERKTPISSFRAAKAKAKATRPERRGRLRRDDREGGHRERHQTTFDDEGNYEERDEKRARDETTDAERSPKHYEKHAPARLEPERARAARSRTCARRTTSCAGRSPVGRRRAEATPGGGVAVTAGATPRDANLVADRRFFRPRARKSRSLGGGAAATEPRGASAGSHRRRDDRTRGDGGKRRSRTRPVSNETETVRNGLRTRPGASTSDATVLPSAVRRRRRADGVQATAQARSGVSTALCKTTRFGTSRRRRLRRAAGGVARDERPHAGARARDGGGGAPRAHEATARRRDGRGALARAQRARRLRRRRCVRRGGTRRRRCARGGARALVRRETSSARAIASAWEGDARRLAKIESATTPSRGPRRRSRRRRRPSSRRLDASTRASSPTAKKKTNRVGAANRAREVRSGAARGARAAAPRSAAGDSARQRRREGGTPTVAFRDGVSPATPSSGARFPFADSAIFADANNKGHRASVARSPPSVSARGAIFCRRRRGTQLQRKRSTPWSSRSPGEARAASLRRLARRWRGDERRTRAAGRPASRPRRPRPAGRAPRSRSAPTAHGKSVCERRLSWRRLRRRSPPRRGSPRPSRRATVRPVRGPVARPQKGGTFVRQRELRCRRALTKTVSRDRPRADPPRRRPGSNRRVAPRPRFRAATSASGGADVARSAGGRSGLLTPSFVEAGSRAGDVHAARCRRSARRWRRSGAAGTIAERRRAKEKDVSVFIYVLGTFSLFDPRRGVYGGRATARRGSQLGASSKLPRGCPRRPRHRPRRAGGVAPFRLACAQRLERVATARRAPRESLKST